MQQTAGVKADFTFLIHGRTGQFQAAQSRFFTSGIRVERQNEVACVPFEQLELVFGQRGAHRRDGIFKAGLVQTDHVHVPFDDHSLFFFADGLPGAVQPKQQPPFVKKVSAGGIQVLGDVFWVQHPPAKPGQVPGGIPDRKY